jgi:arylsulfatase A-like enzyme
MTSVTEPELILLITVDSLRSDRVSIYNPSLCTTPFLGSLGKLGCIFTDANSHGGATPESMPSIMSSCLPPLVNPLENPSGYAEFISQRTSIQSVLHEHGYVTAFLHSNPFLSKAYGFDRDFDYFSDYMRLGTLQHTFEKSKSWFFDSVRKKSRNRNLYELYYDFELLFPPFVKGEVITRDAGRFLRENVGRKCFLWLHYMDCHTPYGANILQSILRGSVSPFALAKYGSSRYATYIGKNYDADDIAVLRQYYDLSIRYVDEQILHLFRTIQTLGKINKTVVVITADHGEAFGEHNFFQHGHVYQELLKVPLILFGPTVRSSKVICSTVSLSDIAPTILELANISAPKEFVGRSIMPLTINDSLSKKENLLSVAYDARSHSRYISLRTGSWKYIRGISYNRSGCKVFAESLYNLDNDPSESRDCKTIEPERKIRMSQSLDDVLEGIAKVEVFSTSISDDSLIMDRLKRLGYA